MRRRSLPALAGLLGVLAIGSFSATPADARDCTFERWTHIPTTERSIFKCKKQVVAKRMKKRSRHARIKKASRYAHRTKGQRRARLNRGSDPSAPLAGQAPLASQAPLATPAIAAPILRIAPIAPLSPQAQSATSAPGGGGETLQDCLNYWDSATHMTKAEWRRACVRIQNRLEYATASTKSQPAQGRR